MDRIKLIEAFRDFFYYGKKKTLKASYSTISHISGTNLKPETIDWEQEEFAFNRLFIGPMTPLAPAVASFYLDPEQLIQGWVTAKVRDFYQTIGLSLPEIGREPEDSIAYELDACRYLLHLGKTEAVAKEAYNGFINEHMALWVPQFATLALEQCGDSLVMREVLVLLSDWVQKESVVISTTKEVS